MLRLSYYCFHEGSVSEMRSNKQELDHILISPNKQDCYEAFVIASFFALLCQYIAPTLHDQKEFFRSQYASTVFFPASKTYPTNT